MTEETSVDVAPDPVGIDQEAVADAVAGAMQVEELTPETLLVERAAKSLSHLFEVMDIQRVISVDDTYEGSLDDLLGMAAVAAAAGTHEFAGGTFDLSVEEEIWRSQLQEAWESGTVRDQRLLLAAAHKESGDQDIEERQLDVSHLEPLLVPTRVEFEAVSPADWPGMVSQVVSDAQTKPTLVLFDQEMGERGDEGIRFAEKVFKEDVYEHVYVALLTRKVDKGEENARWLELTQANKKLKGERFVVISKEHLGPDPKTFPDAIKIVLMAKPAAALRAAVSHAVKDATGTAKDELEGLSPDDFQKIIIKSSIHEGVWEAESLLRVFQLMMRNHIRTELYGLDIVKESAAQIRQLWALDEVERSTSSTAQALAHSENYEDAKFVNGVHLPVELGDLFATGDRLYVLVEQPCDLMVRKNGDRSPDIHDVHLLEVRESRPTPVVAGFELPFYGESGASAWVHFGRSICVPIKALDLTVFHTSGESELQLGSACPVGLWPSWEARYKKLQTKFGTVQKQQVALDGLVGGKGLTKDLHRALSQRILHTDSASGRQVGGTVDGEAVRYEIARVGRLRPPLSRALLLQYSLHRARDAYDFPLAAAINS